MNLAACTEGTHGSVTVTTREPSPRAYQTKERVYFSSGCPSRALQVGSASLLMQPLSCPLPVLLFAHQDPNSIHPHFLCRDPVLLFLHYCCFLFCSFIVKPATCQGLTQSHPAFLVFVVHSIQGLLTCQWTPTDFAS